MTLSLEFPQSLVSPLGKWDPRWKLAALVPAAILVAVLTTPAPALIAFAASCLLVLFARIPLGWFALRLGIVALFLALFLIWLPFNIGADDTVWQVGSLRISVDGTWWALVLLTRALSMVSLILVLLATSPLQEILKAAHALRLPGLVIQLSLLTYRYVFLLADEFGRLRTALRVRGYRNRASVHSYRTIGQVTGTLLVRGEERSERVAQAMRCRGFDGVFRTLNDYRTRPADVLAWLLVLLAASALFVWDYYRR